MVSYELVLDKKEKEIEWSKAKCDKYDYMIAAFCGFSAGIIDSLFVGAPGMSKLGVLTDKGADELVKKVADMLWKGDGRSSIDGKPRNAPDTLERAISYLEQSFPVNYDARYAPDLTDTGGTLSSMKPINHHLLSLAHSPDIIGLLFSILDQFTGRASFIDDGKLIRLVPLKDARNNKIMYMQGTQFESRLFCGVCNWIGHLASDLCGSSSTRKIGKTGRGAGLPMPFYNLFLMMDFWDYDGKTFAEIAVKVFEQGYDLRHGATMAIPVFIEELSIKIIWAFKKHFYEKRVWRDCIPSSKHADLRMMLLVGNATLCLVDGIDAVIRTGISGGNPITFLLHMNLVAWGRLVMLIFRELGIRYGDVVNQAVEKYFAELGFNERYVLKQYYDRMKELDQKLEQALKDYVRQVDREYSAFLANIDNSLNAQIGTSFSRMQSSIAWAEKYGVNTNRIIRSNEEMRYWLGEGWK